MAVEILNSPAPISISGNEAVFRVSSTNYPTQQAVNARFILTFLGTVNPPLDGDSILFTFLDNTETITAQLTARPTPDDSGLEMEHLSGVGSQYWLEHMFLPALQGHPVLTEYYDFQWDGALIVDAKYPGEGFVPVINADFSITPLTIINGSDFQAEPNFSLRYRVHVSTYLGSSDYESGPWAYITPPATGSAMIDVAPMLHDLITDIDSALYAPIALRKSTLSMRDYKVELSEVYGTTQLLNDKVIPLAKASTYSTPQKVIKGREPIRVWSLDKFTYRVNKWLGFQGLTREMLFSTAATVSVALPPSTSYVTTLRVTLLKTDGTLLTNNLWIDTSLTADTEHLVSIKAGFTALGLESLAPIEETVYYTLQLVRTGPDTDIMKIYPKKRKKFHTELRYISAYGLPETMLFDGEQEQTSVSTASTYQSPRPAGIKERYHTTQRHSFQGNDTLKLHTGTLTEQQSAGLWEIIHSPQVWVIEDGEPIAVTLSNTEALKLTLNRSGNNLLGQPLEFTYNRE
ncbi:MAG: hypothetical protein ACRBFS_20920 [Aureispira sp.]